jgi:hypothetical protein
MCEGRELQGLKAYFKARIEDLYVPFMVLIDYRGFRMIGNSLFFFLYCVFLFNSKVINLINLFFFVSQISSNSLSAHRKGNTHVR